MIPKQTIAKLHLKPRRLLGSLRKIRIPKTLSCWGTHWDNIWVILGLHRGYIGIYRGYIGITGKDRKCYNGVIENIGLRS